MVLYLILLVSSAMWVVCVMELVVRKLMRVGSGSSAVVLPSKWVRELGLKRGDQVKLFYDGFRIVISPLKEDELTKGQILIEGADSVALVKLKSAFLEGITNVKLKAGYEDAIKLMQALRVEIPSTIFLAKPEGLYHTVVFPEVKVEYPVLLGKLCELFKKIARREGDLKDLVVDFEYTHLFLLRSLKTQLYEDAVNVADALDTVLFAMVLRDLVDKLVYENTELSEEVVDALSLLVDQYKSEDLDTAVRVASNALLRLGKLPQGLQKHVSIVAELIFRKCIRDKACRCKHFYPKI